MVSGGRQPIRNAAAVMQRIETDRDHFLPFCHHEPRTQRQADGKRTRERRLRKP